MTGKHVTSFDVAKEAGVSRSTVSLVLNDSKSVTISKETKQRVIEAARCLGYVPHAAGQALASKRTKNIGFIYCESQTGHDFLLKYLQGLTETASKYGLRLLTNTYKEEEGAESVLALTRAKHIDGLVMSEPRIGDPVLHQLAEDRFPVVLIGSLPAERLCSIDIDNAAAAQKMTSHLTELGHTRIACITNAPPEYTAAAARLAGYRRALEIANINYDQQLVKYGNYTAESGRSAMKELLREYRPTAVFVSSDTVAFGAIRAIHEARLSIPKDIAVAGFDNIALACYSTPPLTTLFFSAVGEGRRAAELLVELIDGKLEPGYHEEVETQILIRESTVGASARHNE